MGAWAKVCGAECGIVTAGLATAVDRHWSSVTGTPTIETSIVRTGSRSFKFAAAATRPYLTTNIPASQTFGYFIGFFRTDDITPASDAIISHWVVTVGNNFTCYLKTTGVLEMSFIGNAPQSSSGVTLAADEWFGIEYQLNVSANPHVVKWRVWSAGTGWVDQTNVSYAVAAEALATSGCNFGEPISGPTATWNIYWDDVAIAAGTSDGEFYGASGPDENRVTRLLPTADGTHTFTTNDFEYNDTTGIASSATDIYTYLDDSDQTSIADGFISQNVSGIGKFFQVTFGDESTYDSPRAVGVTNTFHSSSTAANEANVRVSDDGATWTNVWGDWAGVGIDISDTSAHFRHKVLATKPTGGAWTLAAVNAMRAEMGASNDVSPVPYYDSVSLEVLWSATAAAPSSDWPGRRAPTLALQAVNRAGSF